MSIFATLQSIVTQAWANPGFLGADIYLRTQDQSTTIHEQIIANLYYIMKLFEDIRNYMRTFANPTVSIRNYLLVN